MKVDLLLKNGITVTWNEITGKMVEEVQDVAVLNGKIVEIGKNLTCLASEVRDLDGLHLLPGCIDSQVHFREPGLTHKEDLETGTRSALMGGITAIFEMPNTNPGTTTWEAFEDKLQRMPGRAWTHYAFFVGATPDNAEVLKSVELHPHCSGVKIFMGSSTGSLLVDEEAALERILSTGQRRVIVHSEDEARLKERKHIAITEAHPRAHNHWRDVESALISTQRLLKIARKTGRKVHVLHVTTKDEMELLKLNKDIATVEVLPQHLTLNAPECYERLGTLAQMNPPIREQSHQDGLWSAILDGTVDVLGSDHAPHTLEEKAKIYPQSPSGMPGTQTLLPLILTHSLNGKLPLLKAVELLTEGPRKVFNIKNKGRIQKGYDADFSIVKLNQEWTLKNEDVVSRCGWSPFIGFNFKAKVDSVYLMGKLAMKDGFINGQCLGKPVHFETSK